jgi:hypothetical protein
MGSAAWDRPPHYMEDEGQLIRADSHEVEALRTYWIEHADGGGHWASNWEMRNG